MKAIIKKIQNTIKNTKFDSKVYVVGGAPRDYFMGKESKDIDLVVVDLGLEGGIEFAYYLHKIFNTSVPVVFKKFGTAHLVMDDTDIEIVAARKEVYNFKNRMPVVYAGTLEEDINRRDFSINSICYNISQESFVDPKGGILDIEKRIIRTTSDPDIIFAEDPLRIMRAIRFSAQFGFEIEENTLNSIVKFVPWLKNISNERIRDEFNKILVAKDFIHGITLLKNTGILSYMIKEFDKIDTIQDQGKYHNSHNSKNLWNHTLEVMSNVPATVKHRLAALLHDIGKINTMSIKNGEIHFYQHQFHSMRIAKNFMIRYKYINKEIEWITNAIQMHMNFLDNFLEKTIRKMVNKYGKDQFLFFTDLAMADSKRQERKDIVQSIINFVNADNCTLEPVKKLPVNGNMIMDKFNIKPGKEVGRLLAIEKEFLFEFPDASIEDIWNILENNKE